MQPKTHHLPATAWHIVWTRPWGSSVGWSEWAKTTPDVPRVALTTPAETMPLPTAPAGWSPLPPTTGVPALRPSSLAASVVRPPVISWDSWTAAGRRALSISSSERSSSLQRRLRAARGGGALAAPTAGAGWPGRGERVEAFGGGVWLVLGWALGS